MQAGGPVRGAGAAHRRSRSQASAPSHCRLLEVGVAGAQATAVVYGHRPVARHHTGEGDYPRSRGPDVGPGGRAEIHSPVPGVTPPRREGPHHGSPLDRAKEAHAAGGELVSGRTRYRGCDDERSHSSSSPECPLRRRRPATVPDGDDPRKRAAGEATPPLRRVPPRPGASVSVGTETVDREVSRPCHNALFV